MVVLMAEHNALTEAAHPMVCVVSLQTLQTLLNRRILLWLCIFRTYIVAAEGIETDGWSLVGIEGFGDDWSKFSVSGLIQL
jgi:hypothetical protein